jgi:adenine phosphoribosyltransferase
MSPITRGPAHLAALIRAVPDFPRPGVTFRDITPLLADPVAFTDTTARMAEPFRGAVTAVVGIDARGFLLAAPIAQALGLPLVPVRKQGKLPWDTHAHTYELEYGTDTLEVHRDALAVDDLVLVVDDVLATGGTAAAACELVTRYFDATVAGVTVLLEIAPLGGRTRLGDVRVETLLTV